MGKIDFDAVGAQLAGALGGSLIDFGLTGLNMARQQQYNVRNMREQVATQQAAQRNQLAGLLGSGFNPAFGSDSPSVSSPSSGNPTPGSFSTRIDPLQALATSMQLRSLNEDVQRKKLENKGLAIDIENKEARKNELGLLNKEFRKKIFASGEDPYGVGFDYDFSVDPGIEGRLQARKYMGEYQALTHEFEDRSIQADFRRLVSQGKMDNDDVMKALIQMDKQTYDSVVADIKNKGLEATYKGLMNDFQRMENEEFQSTKWSQFLANMKSDMSIGDKLLSLLGFIAMNFVKRR